jgi:hypothetical protein
MREYRYRVDTEGRIFHDGSEVVDSLTLRFFLLAMTRTPEGRWLAVCQGEQNWFEPDETPFVVQRVRPVAHDGASTPGPRAGRRLSRAARPDDARERKRSLLPGAAGRVPARFAAWRSSRSARTS